MTLLAAQCQQQIWNLFLGVEEDVGVFQPVVVGVLVLELNR